MNAMQQAMVSAISKDTKFPKFNGVVKSVVVQPKPHLIIPIRSNGDGAIKKGKKITRDIESVIETCDDGVLLRDSCGEVWKAELVTDYVYRARS